MDDGTCVETAVGDDAGSAGLGALTAIFWALVTGVSSTGAGEPTPADAAEDGKDITEGDAEAAGAGDAAMLGNS